MAFIRHIIAILLVVIGFYLFYSIDQTVDVKLIVGDYTITAGLLELYGAGLIFVLLIYLIIRFSLAAGGLSSWVHNYQHKRKSELADKLTRQAIEAWILGDMVRAGKKFSKASEILGPDPLRDIFEAWILSSNHQLQLADAKILNLLNQKLIHQDSTAGIRARIYMERGQPVVAAAILEQQFEHRMHQGLLKLYCQLLSENKAQLKLNYIEKVEKILPNWRLVNKTKAFSDLLHEAIRLSIADKNDRFYNIWQYAKSTLAKEDVLLFEFQKRCQLDNDVKGAVSWLNAQLKNAFYLKLYECLGIYEYHLDQQMELAKRWRSYAPRDIEAKVLARLYLRGNDPQGTIEHARDYLSLIDKS